MNSVATVAQPQLEAYHSPPQLNLPTGPTHVVRGRRERTDEDKAWHSEQVKVGMEVQNVHYREVWRQMVYLASCNPGRLCFAGHATLGRMAGGTDERAFSTKTVQRSVKFLQGEGLLKCLSVGSCRSPGTYLILGRVHVDSKSLSRGLPVHQLEEGIDRKNKDLSFKAEAKSIDPVPTQTEGLKKAVVLTDFPSKEKKQEKTPVTKDQEKAPPPCEPVVFTHTKQVSLLFKLQRKLGYRADDEQARVFDGLEHADRKRILDKLLGEEQLAAAQGKVTAPPKAAPSPRHECPLPVARNTVRERPSCTEHRWTPPASDGVSNCYDCPEERKANDSV